MNEQSRKPDLTMPLEASDDKKVSIGEFIMQYRVLTSNKPTLVKNQKALKLVEYFIASTIQQMSQLQEQITKLQDAMELKEDTTEIEKPASE